MAVSELNNQKMPVRPRLNRLSDHTPRPMEMMSKGLWVALIRKIKEYVIIKLLPFTHMTDSHIFGCKKFQSRQT